MERIGQTRKRTGETSESGGATQKRRKPGEMMEWLQERIELEKEEAQRMQH